MSAHYPNLFEVLTDDGDNIAKEIDRQKHVIIKEVPVAQKKKDTPKKAQPNEEGQTPEGGFETQGQNRQQRPRPDKASPETSQGGDRGQRGGRGGRGGFRGDRPPRPNGEGRNFPPRGEGQGDRPPRGDRPEGERRPFQGDRPPRGDREANGQQGGNRGGRGGGRGGDRPPRAEGDQDRPRRDYNDRPRQPRREGEEGQNQRDRPPREYREYNNDQGQGVEGGRRGRGGGRGGRGGYSQRQYEGGAAIDGQVDSPPPSEGHSGHRRPHRVQEDRLSEEKGFVQTKQRAFDRKSATGRIDTDKKKGAGAGNWGTIAEETPEAIAEAVAYEKTVESEAVAPDTPVPEGAVEVPISTPAETKEPAAEDEKSISLKEYREAQEKEHHAVELPAPRQAEEKDWGDYRPITRDNESTTKLDYLGVPKKAQKKPTEGSGSPATPSAKSKAKKGKAFDSKLLGFKTEERREREDRSRAPRRDGGQRSERHAPEHKKEEKKTEEDASKPDSSSTAEFPALVSSVASGVSSVASAVTSAVSSVVSSVLPTSSK